MSTRIVRYAGAALGAALLVTLIALAVAPAGDRRGVLAGAAAALLVQIGLVLLLHAAFPQRRMLVIGLAMLGRFAVFAAAALVLLLVPAVGLPVGATLLTLVGVFFTASLLEPVFLGPEPMLRS